MSWNNQNGGGGWKSGGGGGGGPWGQGPWGQGGGSGQQPDLEEFLKRGQDKIKQVMPGSGLPGPMLFLIFLVGAAVLAFFAFTFTVRPDESGVVLRFGKFDREVGQGIHFRLPYPLEDVRKPTVTRENSTHIGMRLLPTFRGGAARKEDVPEESLMLTGDENIVDVDFMVRWRIKSENDPKTGQSGAVQYLFNIRDPRKTVKEVAESVMREVVGQSDIQPILTEGKAKAEQAVRKLIQKSLDSYQAGIRITTVQLLKADPPAKVIAAFKDVQAARTDQERFQNEARAYANRVVPEARGQAERILQAAEAYRQKTIAEAVGQADRFKKVYAEFKKAPEVTRQRIFLETMERVFKGTDKIILDGKGGSGVVPYLPLNELRKKSNTSGGQ